MGINGTPSMSQVAAEFGGSVPHSLNEYYGVRFANGGSSPYSGTISLNHFRNMSIGLAVIFFVFPSIKSNSSCTKLIERSVVTITLLIDLNSCTIVIPSIII